jgi:hypothetical protein
MSDARLVAAALGDYCGGSAQRRAPGTTSRSKPCGRADGKELNPLGHSSDTCHAAGTDVTSPHQNAIKYPELGQAFLTVRRSVWVLQRFIPRSFVPRSPNCSESVSTPSTQITGSSGGVVIRSGWRGSVVGAGKASRSAAARWRAALRTRRSRWLRLSTRCGWAVTTSNSSVASLTAQTE